jgi:glutamate N-acetyltransferase/amino-acid N-acetyltransferase
LGGIDRLNPVEHGGLDFAHAIMTTDTKRKISVVERDIGGVTIRVGGVAKGAGMIHPNMATLLGIITTDASIEPRLLQSILKPVIDKTFNMISVDGDTSTNDAVVVMANGAAGGPPLSANTVESQLFADALLEVCGALAKQIVQDAEGARSMIEVRVTSARNQDEARSIARAITTSTLVKTAVFGGDPNWGRILCAAGYSGADIEPAHATLHLNDVCLFRQGIGMPYDRDVATKLLLEPVVTFALDVGLGSGTAVAWGCDMSYEYVRINAEYTT